VNQLSAYLEVSALCLLVVGLAVPSSRNLMMLIVYGQSVHVRTVDEMLAEYSLWKSLDRDDSLVLCLKVLFSITLNPLSWNLFLMDGLFQSHFLEFTSFNP